MKFRELRQVCSAALPSRKTLLVMKLIIVLLFSGLLQAGAKSYGQRVSLSAKNTAVEKLFQSVEKQTGCVFFYDNGLVQNLKITLEVSNVTVDELLNKYFAVLPLTFTVINQKNIVVGRKPETVSEEAVVKTTPPVEITGRVMDEADNPLAGATVLVKGTNSSAVAGKDGSFRINADLGSTLVFSFVGYESFELKLTRITAVNVALKAKPASMNEVVIVTGYAQRKASEITGSVQKIDGDELRQGVSTTNPLAMLKGKTTGLYITETGGGSVSNRGQVVMRGQASFGDAGNTNYGPLIVLDGVITTAINLQDIVNPNDIESITVLKDAASTAIYGSRAAQGVLVVTTKRGTRGRVAVNLNLKYGDTKDNRLVRFMNTKEVAAHINKYMEVMYNNTPSIRSQFATLNDFYNTTRPFKEADVNNYQNWDKVLYTDGHEKDINLSLSAGSDKTKLYGAIDWYREDGTLIDDNLDRKSVRLNVDQQLSGKFSVSVNANAIIDKYLSSNSENQYYLFQPWVLSTYANGGFADSIPNYNFRATAAPIVRWYDNPVFSHSYNTAIRKVQSYLGTGVLKYDVLPWLSLRSSNTVQFINNNLNSYRDPRTFRGRWDGPASGLFLVNGEITVTDIRTEYFLTSNQASFNKRFGNHSVNALLGQEWGKTYTETFSAAAYNTAYPGERNLGAFKNYGSWLNLRPGATAAIPSSAASVEKASFSLFSEANYNYRQKYFASASLRRDASTNFGKLNRYGTFYSVSGGWLMSAEKFMSGVKPVTNLRLRASYGTSGREAGADFLNFTVYQDNVRYNDANTFGSSIQRLGNDQITWETTYTTNLGFDVSLWKRIDLNVDLYNRRSADLIQAVQLPSYIGFPSQTRNIGELTNKGIEVAIGSTNIKNKAFEWTTDFNISFNKNKLTKIYGDSLRDPWSGSYYRYVNEDLNVLKAVIYAGVNPDNGRPLFERVMPDGKIAIVDSLPTILSDGIRSFKTVGSATPKFFGGITNTFRYKNITLSVLLNFAYGNKIMNQSVNNFLDPTSWQAGFNLVNPDKAIRLWQGPGDTKANYPNFYDLAFAQRGATSFRSSLIFQDASYIRLRNIRIGYDLPKSLLQRAKMGAANIYVSADNLYVIQSKDLFAADPEGARLGSTNGAFTGTGFASAMPKRFMAGLNLSF